MPRLTAKDKTHPSPRSGPFLSNNVHNGVLRCRYCVNNLNSDLGYWAPRSQPQQRPSRRGSAGEGLDIPDAFFIFFFALKIRCLKAFDTNAAFNSAGCVHVEIKSDGKKLNKTRHICLFDCECIFHGKFRGTCFDQNISHFSVIQLQRPYLQGATPPLPGMAGHDHGAVLGVSFN